jgi:RNA polymerase sigma-70 factor (ECF subfamily)
MVLRDARSTGVSETLTMALPEQEAPSRFEDLYRSCRDDVYAYVVTLLRDASSAEDVTALAFERAYRRRRLFDARRGSERAWVFGIARNAALDELRRRKRVASLATDVEDADAAAPGDEAEASAMRETVRRAMSELEPREREVIALKFFAGLSNDELARVLGTSPSNAGTILHRAVQRLRKACHVTP